MSSQSNQIARDLSCKSPSTSASQITGRCKNQIHKYGTLCIDKVRTNELTQPVALKASEKTRHVVDDAVPEHLSPPIMPRLSGEVVGDTIPHHYESGHTKARDRGAGLMLHKDKNNLCTSRAQISHQSGSIESEPTRNQDQQHQSAAALLRRRCTRQVVPLLPSKSEPPLGIA